MQTADFYFDLPEHLIAQTPLVDRSSSRLLVCDAANGQYYDQQFRGVVDLVNSNDLLVFNDTRVIPARVYGEKKQTGGKIEILVERIVQSHRALCHLKASKSPKAGTELLIAGQVDAIVTGREGELFIVELPVDQNDFWHMLELHGAMPLPPYIERAADENDSNRYQTVYAREPGAVAAPTAGLHFDEPLLQALQKKGVDSAFVTLHVGAGTFQPVRVTDPDQHIMHAEWDEVSAAVCEKISAARARGGRVIAVGTTVVRSLESATIEGVTTPFSGDTRIFITPGYRFQCVDTMLTNFHLPESTLMMLVCAFGGYDFMMSAYQHAVQLRYRFFSYGDAMMITSNLIKPNEI